MKREVIQDIKEASSIVEVNVDEIKSYAYNWNLLGNIPIKTVNINSEFALQALRKLDSYIQEQISDLEMDIEVQK